MTHEEQIFFVSFVAFSLAHPSTKKRQLLALRDTRLLFVLKLLNTFGRRRQIFGHGTACFFDCIAYNLADLIIRLINLIVANQRVAGPPTWSGRI